MLVVDLSTSLQMTSKAEIYLKNSPHYLHQQYNQKQKGWLSPNSYVISIQGRNENGTVK